MATVLFHHVILLILYNEGEFRYISGLLLVHEKKIEQGRNDKVAAILDFECAKWGGFNIVKYNVCLLFYYNKIFLLNTCGI